MRLLFLLAACAAFIGITAAGAADPARELEKKGIAVQTLKLLNPACHEALDIDFGKDHRFWNSLGNKKGEMVTFDFLKGTKHYTVALLPLSPG